MPDAEANGTADGQSRHQLPRHHRVGLPTGDAPAVPAEMAGTAATREISPVVSKRIGFPSEKIIKFLDYIPEPFWFSANVNPKPKARAKVVETETPKTKRTLVYIGPRKKFGFSILLTYHARLQL